MLHILFDCFGQRKNLSDQTAACNSTQTLQVGLCHVDLTASAYETILALFHQHNKHSELPSSMRTPKRSINRNIEADELLNLRPLFAVKQAHIAFLIGEELPCFMTMGHSIL